MLKKRILFSGAVIMIFASLFIYHSAFAQPGALRQAIKEKIKERRGARQPGRQSQDSPYPVIEGSVDASTGAAYKAGNYRRYLNFGGRERFYDLHLPASYSQDTAMPLVLNFHGGSGNPVQQREDTGMDAAADQQGFIIVYPAGTGPLGKHKILFWNAGVGGNPAVKNNVDDVGFVAALLDDIAKIFNIDKKRVYATGISNGGFMSYRLACELNGRLAAIAPVAAVADIGACKKSPLLPISVIHFHGKEDPTVPYGGGTSSNSPTLQKVDLPSVQETIKFWVRFNGCPAQPADVIRNSKALCEIYGPGRNNTEVVLWTLEDAGHTWPGGNMRLPESKVGRTNRDINASELILEFFRRYSR